MAPKQLNRKYTSALDIPYIKRMIFTLNTIGSWPHDVMGEKKWFTDLKDRRIIFTTIVVCVLLFLSFIKKNFATFSFLEMGRHYINVLICFVCLQRLYMPGTEMYKVKTKTFFLKFHLFYHKDKNDYAMKTYKNVEKISDLFCKVLHCQIYIGVILYNLTPLYNSYRRGMFKSIKPINETYDHSCFYDLPFDYTTKFKGFLSVFIFNCFFTFDVACTVSMLDLYLFIIIFHIWGHIKILKYNLIHFPRPEMKDESNVYAYSWYSKEESDMVKNLLIESMEYYKFIKEFMDLVSEVWGAAICFYFLFHQVIGCLLLVEISQLNAEAFGSYGILTFVTFQQFIEMSIIFELIGYQSETIKDAVYAVPWECMDTKNRKLVLNYLCNVQNPMNLKALGMVPVGVQTMASVLKTSISYFMLLRTST